MDYEESHEYIDFLSVYNDEQNFPDLYNAMN